MDHAGAALELDAHGLSILALAGQAVHMVHLVLVGHQEMPMPVKAAAVQEIILLVIQM